MNITDRVIATTQFVGVCLSVVCMLIGGGIYLYRFAWYQLDLGRNLDITSSKAFLISGVLLLIFMQVVRVFMVFVLFLETKQKVLSIVSFMILVILVINLCVANFI
jgi:uncharacterized membrane protein